MLTLKNELLVLFTSKHYTIALLNIHPSFLFMFVDSWICFLKVNDFSSVHAPTLFFKRQFDIFVAESQNKNRKFLQTLDSDSQRENLDAMKNFFSEAKTLTSEYDK